MTDAVLVAVIAIALAFDFTNGFHDTANAVATTVSTRALPPRIAVLIASLANFAGAFVSTAVASFIWKDLLGPTVDITGRLLIAALLGAIGGTSPPGTWGCRPRSSHALIGGLVGSGLAAAGSSAIQWHGLWDKVVVPRSRARSSDSCWPAGSCWRCCGDFGVRARRR